MSVPNDHEIEFNPNFECNKTKNGIITQIVNNERYLFRVHLYNDQYLIAFPRFGCTIGIGFLLEDDYNRNLPFDSENVLEHIWHNHKYAEITQEMVMPILDQLRSKIQEYLAVNFIDRTFGCKSKWCPQCPRPECVQACKNYQHRWHFSFQLSDPNGVHCNVCHINRKDADKSTMKFIYD